MDASVSWSARILLFSSLSHALVHCSVISFTLNDGNEMPVVALGTSLGHRADGTRILSMNHSLARAVQWALEAGYRHIDTAALYLVEDEVGLGVQNYMRDTGVPRSDIYITTKLWNDAHELDEVLPALKKSLQDLQLTYVDQYLMHYPMAYKTDGSISETDYLITWKGMEEAKRLNVTRSIGVSNFNLTQMQRLWDNSVIKPAVLQIEVNPTITQDELVEWCRKHGVVVTAYTPFGAILGRKKDAPHGASHTYWAGEQELPMALLLLPDRCRPLIRGPFCGLRGQGGRPLRRGRVLDPPDELWESLGTSASTTRACTVKLCSGRRTRVDHPLLQELSRKYNKTVPQIVLRYLLDRNIAPIPRSTNKERIRQNIDILDFSLTEDEVTQLSRLNSNYRLRTPAKWYPHPHFPFEKKNLTETEIQYIIEHSKQD